MKLYQLQSLRKILHRSQKNGFSEFPRCSAEGLQSLCPPRWILQFSMVFMNLRQAMLEPGFTIWGPISNPHAWVEKNGLTWPPGQVFRLITIALKRQLASLSVEKKVMYQSLVHTLHKWGPSRHPGVYCHIIVCRPIPSCIPEKKHPLRGPEWQGAPSQLGIEDYVLQFATQYHPQGDWPVCMGDWGVDHGFLRIVSSPWYQACARGSVAWAYVLHRRPLHAKHWNWMSVGKEKTYWTECHCGGVIEPHCEDCRPKGFWRTGVRPPDRRV